MPETACDCEDLLPLEVRTLAWRIGSGDAQLNHADQVNLAQRNSIFDQSRRVVLRLTGETHQKSSVSCGMMLTLVWVTDRSTSHDIARSRRSAREMNPSSASLGALLIAGSTLVVSERHVCDLWVAVLTSHTERGP